MTKHAPYPIHLPDGQLLLAEPIEHADYRLHGFENEVSISGAFAKSLSALIHGHAHANDKKRLALLEKHDWLQGLSHASSTPSCTPQQTLIGSELGMLFVELTDQCNEKSPM